MTATRTIAAPATVVTFITPDMMTFPERFDDCRAVNLFAVGAEPERKHSGRKPDQSIRDRLITLIRRMSDAAGASLVQADVLAAAAAEDIAAPATLRAIMAECAAAAGVTVEVLRGRRGPRGPMGQRDTTIVRERLFREAMGEIAAQHPDGIDREELERVLLADDFKPAYVKAMASPIAKEIGLTIHDRAKTGRKVDTFRIEVTRKALAAADAAGLVSRDAIVKTVLRFWSAHQVECAHTPTAAYNVILQVRKMDAPAPVVAPFPVVEQLAPSASETANQQSEEPAPF